jgi:hypothetical protein
MNLNTIISVLSKFNTNLDNYENLKSNEENVEYTFYNLLKCLNIENKIHHIVEYIEEHQIIDYDYRNDMEQNTITDKILVLITKIFNINIIFYNKNCNFFKLYTSAPTLNKYKLHSFYVDKLYDSMRLSTFNITNIENFINTNKANIFLIETDIKLEFNDYDEYDEELVFL